MRLDDMNAAAMTADQPIVSAQNLRRRYGEGETAVDALAGVSADFAPGGFTAIMGPSGSGKSTLMNVLAGLDRPTEGSVQVAGTEITTLDDNQLTRLRRDKLGFVFQFFNLLPVLTAVENIELPLSLAGRDPDREWLDRLIATVGLEARRDHRPSQLSGGEQQRVAVARALLSRPAVVFADEPTGNLDSKASEGVLALLRRSVDEFGQSVVMVTHDEQAASYADRRLVLVDGKVLDLISVALKGLRARRLRTALTALAIMLGVSLMAGTYVLTDTFDRSFDDIFEATNEGIDVAIIPREIVTTESGEAPAMGAPLLADVERVPGVRKAAGQVFSNGVVIFDKDGERVGTGRAPSFGTSSDPDPFNPIDYVEGRAPRNASEVVIDEHTADDQGFEIGDRIRIGGDQPARDYRLVGVGRLGNVANFGGATISEFVLPEAQRVSGKVGRFDAIAVQADPGVQPRALADRIRAALPPDTPVNVRTGAQNAQLQKDEQLGDFLGFIRTALLVFAGIALFVGAFTIFNTFSITVAQRTREFGVLRTLGASRTQVLAAVLIEAFAIALVASALGVLAGIGMASVLRALLETFGISLPSSGNVVLPRTVIVSILVGVTVTMFAALVPAIRATHVTPMEALRDAATPPTERRRRLVAGFAWTMLIGGIVLCLYGLFGGIDDAGAAAGAIGGGAAVTFLGVALLSPKLVPPIAAAVGKPLEAVRGLTGRLARENTVRNPSRTATTAAALMIGLALVTFVAVFAAGIKGSIDDAIDDAFQGDLALQSSDGFSPLPVVAGPAVARVPGVAAVSGLAVSAAKLGTNRVQVVGIDPSTVTDVIDLKWKDGSDETVKSLPAHGVIADHQWAKDYNLPVGGRFKVTTPTGKLVEYTLVGTIDDPADLFGDFAINRVSMASDFAEARNRLEFIAFEPGADQAAVRERIERVVDKDFPVAEVLNQDELKDKQSERLDQLLGLLYALLSLAVIVSLFGIVNTLTLSIYERTRELGLLRAIGMSRRQVRRVVRYESVITALIGAVLGLVLGVFFSVIVSRPLAEEGFTLSFPVVTLLLLTLLAIIAGIVAAILPARRAARLDILEALAYE